MRRRLVRPTYWNTSTRAVALKPTRPTIDGSESSIKPSFEARDSPADELLLWLVPRRAGS